MYVSLLSSEFEIRSTLNFSVPLVFSSRLDDGADLPTGAWYGRPQLFFPCAHLAFMKGTRLLLEKRSSLMIDLLSMLDICNLVSFPCCDRWAWGI